MNQKELMEQVGITEGDVYYYGQNRKAMEQVGLWLKWIVLPTVLIVLAYLVYLGVMALKGRIGFFIKAFIHI